MALLKIDNSMDFHHHESLLYLFLRCFLLLPISRKFDSPIIIRSFLMETESAY